MIPPTPSETAAFRRDLAAQCDADGPVARALRKLELEAMASAPLTIRAEDFDAIIAQRSHAARVSPAMERAAKRWIDRTAQD